MPIDLQTIEDHVLAELSPSKYRLTGARRNVAYYRCDFRELAYHIDDEEETDNLCQRTTPLMQMFVSTLCNHLYRESPTRTIKGHDKMSSILQQIYKHNNMHAKWQEADRLSTVAQAVAWQVAGTEDPANPVKIHLWPASQFDVIPDPDDPLKVGAVITIDSVGSKKRRYRVWTDSIYREYITEGLTGIPKRINGEGINTLGFIPFVFAHFSPPTTEFWAGGPGDILFQANRHVNYRLTSVADSIRYASKPILVGEGLPADQQSRKIKPGDVLDMKPKSVAAGGEVPRSSLEYVIPDVGFVDAEWLDISNYINHLLEMLGIPEASIRMVQSVARSGVSIMAEQGPLIQRARGRQQQFAAYEDELARLVLRTALVHLKNNGLATHEEFQAVLADWPGLSVAWGDLYTPLPGPETDRGDEWQLRMALQSRIGLLQRRLNMTRDEAVAYLENVAKDVDEESKIVGPLILNSAYVEEDQPQDDVPDDQPQDEQLDEELDDAEETEDDDE